MPLNLPDKLPAIELLKEENIFVIDNSRATQQDIRPEKSAPYVAYGDDNLWDTAEVPDGHCILKVIVHTADGESYETESGFEVKNK